MDDSIFYIILDMFAGVGSTLYAAEKQNRNCVGIELDNEMYLKGVERYKSEGYEKILQCSNY